MNKVKYIIEYNKLQRLDGGLDNVLFQNIEV